jgi:IS30 family transposase
MASSYNHLTPHERDHLAALHGAGLSARAIADTLGRCVSTISRELKRGQDPGGGGYLPHTAQALSWTRRQPSAGRPILLDTPAGRVLTHGLLELMREDRRSVQQALDILTGAGEHVLRVCRQTVYQWMYTSDSETAFWLCEAMIRPRQYRKPRTKPDTGTGRIPGMVSHRERTEACLNRSESGHLEGDLVWGGNNPGPVATLVDRATRWTLVLKLPDSKTGSLTTALLDWISRQAPGAVKSITWDQGHEMSHHTHLTRLTGVPVFFADAHSPWQRGSNENLNGVLRRYYPKGKPIPEDEALTSRIMELLNTRPMPTLSGQTPKEANHQQGAVALQS